MSSWFFPVCGKMLVEQIHPLEQDLVTDPLSISVPLYSILNMDMEDSIETGINIGDFVVLDDSCLTDPIYIIDSSLEVGNSVIINLDACGLDDYDYMVVDVDSVVGIVDTDELGSDFVNAATNL